MRTVGLVAVALLMVAGSGASGQGARRQLSGDLTKPIAEYTGNEFFSLVRGLRFSPSVERQRRCRGNQDCTGAGTRRTRVRIDAVTDADSLAAGNLPQFGVIAARAVNRGADDEGRYGMRSGGRYSYYLIVTPAGPNAATWILQEMDVQGVQRSHRTIASGRFVPCRHAYQRGARADFQTCGQAAAVRRASIGALLQGGDDPPIWIGCASGCCTAESGNGV
jgi:hypothetical protein